MNETQHQTPQTTKRNYELTRTEFINKYVARGESYGRAIRRWDKIQWKIKNIWEMTPEEWANQRE